MIDNLGSWRYLESHDICICVPPKCGITSLRCAVWPWATGAKDLTERVETHNPTTLMAARPDTRKFLAVRHPVERFASLWRDKCRREKYKNPYWERFKGMSPDDLMGLIESWPFGNCHWMPQYAYLVPGVDLVRHDELLPMLGFDLEPRNTTKRLPDDPAMPEARILDHYRKDMELWERTNSSR